MSSKFSVFKLPAVDFRQFALISILFFCGSLLGVIAAGSIDVNSASSFALNLFNNDNGFVVSILSYLKFHFVIILLGLSVLGVFLIPIFSVLKGFTLTFTASCVFSAVNAGVFSGVFVVFYIFQLVSTLMLFLIMLNSVSSSGFLFKAVFFNRDFLRREYVVKNFKYCLVYLLSLVFLYFLLFYLC